MPGFVWVTKEVEKLMALAFDRPQIPAVIALVIINKVLTAWSAVLLYQLAERIAGRGLALGTAVLFLYNPASIFYHSVYSEPLFCVLTFQAIKKVVEWEKAANPA